VVRAPTRYGRSWAFGVGAVVTVIYFSLRSALEPTSFLDLPYALAAAQIPNLLFLAVGLVLIARVDRV
jgi:lipopolysaccharide export LptBFGC system permease protein LptF